MIVPHFPIGVTEVEHMELRDPVAGKSSTGNSGMHVAEQVQERVNDF